MITAPKPSNQLHDFREAEALPRRSPHSTARSWQAPSSRRLTEELLLWAGSPWTGVSSGEGDGSIKTGLPKRFCSRRLLTGARPGWGREALLPRPEPPGGPRSATAPARGPLAPEEAPAGRRRALPPPGHRALPASQVPARPRADGTGLPHHRPPGRTYRFWAGSGSPSRPPRTWWRARSRSPPCPRPVPARRLLLGRRAASGGAGSAQPPSSRRLQPTARVRGYEAPGRTQPVPGGSRAGCPAPCRARPGPRPDPPALHLRQD